MKKLQATLILSLALSGACGREDSEEPSLAESPASESDKQTLLSIALKSRDELPTCDDNNKKQLAYLLDEKIFLVCDNNDWAEVQIKGMDGERGIAGEKGDTGEQGIAGEKGDTGDQGIAGEQGIQGEAGTNGIDGSDALSTRLTAKYSKNYVTPLQLNTLITEWYIVTVRTIEVNFFSDGTSTVYLSGDIYTKEPDTLEWILKPWSHFHQTDPIIGTPNFRTNSFKVVSYWAANINYTIISNSNYIEIHDSGEDTNEITLDINYEE